MTKLIKFDEALTENDYGLIVCGSTGRLKGLWIPTGKDDIVPETIVKLCKDVFGIDVNNDEDTKMIH